MTDAFTTIIRRLNGCAEAVCADPASENCTCAPLIEEATAALDAELAKLRDPTAVHMNMLRGTIAKPTWDQIAHVYAEEHTAALAAAEERGRVKGLREAWSIARGRRDQLGCNHPADGELHNVEFMIVRRIEKDTP